MGGGGGGGGGEVVKECWGGRLKCIIILIVRERGRVCTLMCVRACLACVSDICAHVRVYLL